MGEKGGEREESVVVVVDLDDGRQTNEQTDGHGR